MTQDPDYSIAELDPRRSGQELSLGQRIDADGKINYHVVTRNRRAGVVLEKVYNQDHILIRLEKRAPGSHSETVFEPKTGAVLRISELSTLHDGTLMNKDIVYEDDDRSHEEVLISTADGTALRRVKREHCGIRTVFQGQTEYNGRGDPTTTVDHHMDESTGRLVRREQIKWMRKDHPRLAENFYFDQCGGMKKYSKVLYHSTGNGGPFIEETQIFHSQSQSLIKREVSAFDISGKRTCLDVLTYDDDGEILERHSRFFDKNGVESCPLP